MKYEVPIVYRGQLNYIIDAETPEQAVKIARNKFSNNDKEDILGVEYEEIVRIGSVEPILASKHY